MKNSPIECRFTRKIPSLGDETFLLGHNPVTENSSAPPPPPGCLVPWGGYFQYRGGYHDKCGGYLEYHEGCSVPWGNITIHVKDMSNNYGVFSTVGDIMSTVVLIDVKEKYGKQIGREPGFHEYRNEVGVSINGALIGQCQINFSSSGGILICFASTFLCVGGGWGGGGYLFTLMPTHFSCNLLK